MLAAQTMKGCGCCHECGSRMQHQMDGSEWCPGCKSEKLYRSHGWVPPHADLFPLPDDCCPQLGELADLRRETFGRGRRARRRGRRR